LQAGGNQPLDFGGASWLDSLPKVGDRPVVTASFVLAARLFRLPYELLLQEVGVIAHIRKVGNGVPGDGEQHDGGPIEPVFPENTPLQLEAKAFDIRSRPELFSGIA